MTEPDIKEQLRKIQADLDILNARTEKMYKTDKQWAEFMIGSSAIAFLGTAIILGAIFLVAIHTF